MEWRYGPDENARETTIQTLFQLDILPTGPHDDDDNGDSSPNRQTWVKTLSRPTYVGRR